MNKLKKIGIFVLLIILTVCIVFLPQLMSEQNEEKLLNQKIYWDYNIRGGTKITSNQVAELYYNREIRIGTYNDVSLDTENVQMFIINFLWEEHPLKSSSEQQLINKVVLI